MFLLLKSFSVLLIELKNQNEHFILEAQNDFYNGFLKIAETTQDDILTIKQQVDIFKQKVSTFDTEAVERLEDVESRLYLNLHSNWLQNFNNKFTQNYA